MNTRTKILTSLLLTFGCFTMQAATKDLVIKLLDGTTFTCTIPSEGLTMKFNDGKIWVAGKTFAFTEVDRFYATENVGVGNINQPSLKLNLIDNRTLRIYNATNSEIRLYTVDGKKYPVRAISNNQYTDLNIHTLPAGNYILNVGNQTIKWQKP